MPQEASIFTRVQISVFEELTFTRAQSTNLHILEEVLKRGTVLQAYKQSIPVETDSVLVFADDAPRFNWAHPCRYLLHDAKTGELNQEVHAQFPPYLVKTPANFRMFHEGVSLAPTRQYLIPRPELLCPIRFPVGQRYAVLFAGASNNRHTNDLEFLYRTLRHQYGFKDANIYCLNYDGTHGYNNFGSPPGTTWPGDGTAYQMPIKGKGTKADLDATLDDVKKRLKPDDLLLVHTNNHGGYDGPGKAYLVTYSGPEYYAADFGTKIGTLPKYNTLMVMMEQCHAGGFNAPILANSTALKTTVASACTEPNNSIGGADFDPFARDWIAAMAGHTPYGGALAHNPDLDGNGRIYAEEAYYYADSVHDPYDTPVFSETSEAAGDTHLGQRYQWVYWYCPLITQLLEPHYTAMPIPQFYDTLHTLEPKLQEIEALIDHANVAVHKDVQDKLKKLIDQSFRGKPATA